MTRWRREDAGGGSIAAGGAWECQRGPPSPTPLPQDARRIARLGINAGATAGPPADRAIKRLYSYRATISTAAFVDRIQYPAWTAHSDAKSCKYPATIMYIRSSRPILDHKIDDQINIVAPSSQENRTKDFRLLIRTSHSFLVSLVFCVNNTRDSVTTADNASSSGTIGLFAKYEENCKFIKTVGNVQVAPILWASRLLLDSMFIVIYPIKAI